MDSGVTASMDPLCKMKEDASPKETKRDGNESGSKRKQHLHDRSSGNKTRQNCNIRRKLKRYGMFYGSSPPVNAQNRGGLDMPEVKLDFDDSERTYEKS